MKALQLAFQKDTFTTAIKVAIVVGLILNFINQGDNFIAQNFDEVNWFKFWLTFSVPFMVSTYSSVKAKLAFNMGETAAIDVRLECTHCNMEKIEVKKGETIPICEVSKELTNWEISN